MNGKQLKNSILQLAIQGKLVPQNPTDEPASALLQRIRKEKEQLVKEKKLKKKDLVTTPISDEEKPFELPKGWEWCRMNDLAAYRKGPFGSSLTKSMFVPQGPDSVKVYEQKNAIQKDWKLGSYYISKEKFLDMQGFITKPSDIIVSCAGTIGECYQLPKDAPLGIINQALMRVELFVLEMADYWMLFFEDMLNHNMAMKGAGSAIKNIPPFEILKNIIVPLPPLAEQHRIVAKIEELMPLVEEYDKAQTKLDDLNKKLPEALKKSILQEAIMGKLVAQDPNDEPASVLLQRIRAEKEQLVKEGKLKKKDLVTTPITDEEKPFEIPENWEWCRLGEISTFNGGYAFKSINYVESNQGMRVLRISDFSEEGISDKAPVYHPKDQKLEKFKLEENDIIMCMTGGTVGKSCHIKNLSEDFYVNQRIADLKINPCVYSDYIYKVIASSYIQSIINESKNSTNDNISAQLINDFLIPLPPLSEQHRIVAKIEELFGVLG